MDIKSVNKVDTGGLFSTGNLLLYFHFEALALKEMAKVIKQ